ncbi:hypothetical protein WSK_3506 [Novosphingobium sp. Rr 2-17]|uniref:CopG family ribbon-helix-helix protein n=1 Tax=Novosphingobium sp. Rr 2-17 TaxID=555793 RepID=UPI000269A220|nr:ribbon-helix-helix domain-containing protein [Novosphingobium sp. Rr 2-17]EIZ77944.1 hypothetical protein WSK_3506 [Novosphingobium sp. Rr 2-17]
MSRITLRLDDDVTDLIDMLAKAAGMTRSAWVARAIRDSLDRRPEEVRDIPASSAASKTLALRLPADEMDAIDLVAARAGMTRSQWVKRTLRWQLWTKAGELRLVPSSYRSIMKIVAQVRAIGYSLNQAVKAMNAANRPESPLVIEQVAGHVIALEERLSSTIGEVNATLTAIVSGEVAYWTGRDRKLPGADEMKS